jgi:photosystem II stability/assembly factor-like uncharacterized protein
MATALSSPNEEQTSIAVWHSTDGGETWRQITTHNTPAPWVDIVIPSGVVDNPLDQAIVVAGPYCLRPLRQGDGIWVSTTIDPSGANALSVVAAGDLERGGVLYAATAAGVFSSSDGGQIWRCIGQEMAGQVFTSLAIAYVDNKSYLYALSLGGVLYRRSLL